MKKLAKSTTSKMICGVCGGVANYFAVDPTLIRLAWVLFGCLTGGVLFLAYIVAAIIMPYDNEI